MISVRNINIWIRPLMHCGATHPLREHTDPTYEIYLIHGKFVKKFLGKNKRKCFQLARERFLLSVYIAKGDYWHIFFFSAHFPGSADSCSILEDMRRKREWDYEEQKPKTHIILGKILRCHWVQLSNKIITLSEILTNGHPIFTWISRIAGNSLLSNGLL